MADAHIFESHDSHCGWSDAALDAVADAEVGSRRAARAEAHASECMRCGGRLAAARAYKRRVRQAGDSVRAPAELRDAVMASLRGARGSPTH